MIGRFVCMAAHLERMHVVEREAVKRRTSAKDPQPALRADDGSRSADARRGGHTAELEHGPAHLARVKEGSVAKHQPAVCSTPPSEDRNVGHAHAACNMVEARIGRCTAHCRLADVEHRIGAANVGRRCEPVKGCARHPAV